MEIGEKVGEVERDIRRCNWSSSRCVHFCPIARLSYGGCRVEEMLIGRTIISNLDQPLLRVLNRPSRNLDRSSVNWLEW
jgi:hypothetical protein